MSLYGVVYAASSTMPQPVGPDTLYVSNGALSTKRYITIVYSDPRGIPNYYRWVQYVNGRQEKTILGGDDEFNDGLKVQVQ